MIKKTISILVLIFTMMIVYIGIARADVDTSKITVGSISNTSLKYNGYDYMPFKTAFFNDKNTKYAAFCALYHLDPPSQKTKCTKTTLNSSVAAGVAEIVNKYKAANDTKKAYYYAELAINEFLYEKNGKNKNNRISTIRSAKEVLGDYYSWYSAAVSQYNKINKAFDLKLSASSLKFKEDVNGNYYISNKITVKDTNGNLSGYTTDVSGAEGVKIYEESDNSFYVRLPKSSVSEGSTIKITLKVTGEKKYSIANRYDCGKNVQKLIVNKLEEKTETKSKIITGKITKKQSTISINIKKTDEKGNHLEGAKLTLYSCDDKNCKTKHKIESWTSEKQAKKINGITKDKYYEIEETIAPDGYNKAKPRIIQVTKNNQIFTITNKKTNTSCDDELAKIDSTSSEDLKKLYDKVLDGTINSDCADKKCTALITPDAPNYGTCEVAEEPPTEPPIEIGCDEELDDILSDPNEINRNYRLQQLYLKYPDNTALLNESPTCEVDQKVVESNCSKTTVEKTFVSSYNVYKDSSQELKPVCKLKYNIDTYTFNEEMGINAGSLLWNPSSRGTKLGDSYNYSKVPIIVNINYDCQLYTTESSENIKSLEFELKKILPNIDINYVYQNGEMEDVTKNRNISLDIGKTYDDGKFIQLVSANIISEFTGLSIGLDYTNDGIINVKDVTAYQKKYSEVSITKSSNKIYVSINPLESIQEGYRLYSWKTNIQQLYNYPTLYNLNIGTGIVTSEKCEKGSDCVEWGYGIPIGLSVKPGKYDKSGFSIKFPESVQVQNGDKIEQKSEISNKCSYEIYPNLDYNVRQISEKNPFIDISGNSRKTDNNWCVYGNEKKQNTEFQPEDFEINPTANDESLCDPNNEKVQTYIKNRPNSSSSDDYLMYSFTFTPSNIKKIREENKKTNYNDFSGIKCTYNTNEQKLECLSDFVNDLVKDNNLSSSSNGYCLQKGLSRTFCLGKSLTE